MINFRPTLDGVLLEEIKEDNLSAGGIALVKEDKSFGIKCKVLAVGKDDAPLDFQVGDTIIVDRRACAPIKLDDKEYLMTIIKDVAGVIEDE